MTASAMWGGRRLFAAEVAQTSAMDCGPASLKCLLEGFGIHVSYGRLREACQTDVDGTSIDTIEEAAVQLGLEAEQVIVPVDHLLRPEAAALPALIVVRLVSGFTHFVVAVAPPRPCGAGDGPCHWAALADLQELSQGCLRAYYANPRRRLAGVGGNARVPWHATPTLVSPGAQ
jgi:hypothetical protein